MPFLWTFDLCGQEQTSQRPHLYTLETATGRTHSVWLCDDCHRKVSQTKEPKH
jgi:hypothetical protein